MKSVEKFSEAVCEKLGHYVYRLIDPRNGETFYVGKGKGNRVFAHVNLAIKLDEEWDETTEKLDRIKQIRSAGLNVIHVIHRHEIPAEAVSEVEAALIDAYPGLTNIQGGTASGARGPMSAAQIVDKYDLPELEFTPSESLVLINVNSLQETLNRTAIYDQVRYAWKINMTRAAKADYVLAVRRGVVVGAFVADDWLSATPENFPERPMSPLLPGRWGFVGREAPKDVWDRFVGSRGKRVVNDALKHVQNPIRYWRV
ncbi:hypothetical protein CSC82_03790 [Rhodobacteraceae bacterium 4F10]|nr:hypothetical protein CSC82_03790 [Rhodobacteraceae bacterium 4F10]